MLRGPAANSDLVPPEWWRPRRARTFLPSTFRARPSQNDYSYPCTGNAECGRVISEAIANQTAWLTEAQGPDALMITYLWQEGLGYLEAGTLIIPPTVNTIFTDSGAGNVRFDPALAAKYGAFNCARAWGTSTLFAPLAHRVRHWTGTMRWWWDSRRPPSRLADCRQGIAPF